MFSDEIRCFLKLFLHFHSFDACLLVQVAYHGKPGHALPSFVDSLNIHQLQMVLKLEDPEKVNPAGMNMWLIIF